MADTKISALASKATPTGSDLAGIIDVADSSMGPSGSNKKVTLASLPVPTLAAPLASPALTGTPTAPTAAPGTNTTQVATTAFVLANGGTPGALVAANNLSDVASATTARTNLGLGTAATHPATDFQPAGSYATATQGGKADTAVQSIVLTTPAVLYSSPVTFSVAGGAATATETLLTQAAHAVLAGPTSGAAATPTIRLLVAADIPDLSATYSPLAGSTSLVTAGTITAGTWQGTPVAAAYLGSHTHAASDITGTLGIGHGGTGLTTVASGKLLYASALDTLAPLTLGTNLSITGGTLNAAGGGSAPFSGGTSSPLVKDATDATKLAAFDASGITTGTTRTYVLPNANATVAGSASALTSGRVPFATTGGLLTDSTALTFTGSMLSVGTLSMTAGNNIAVNGDDGMWLMTNATAGTGAYRLGLYGNNILNNWTGQFGWSNLGLDANPDVGLARAVAGVVKFTNGSTGSGGLSSVGNTPTTLAANANNYSPGVGMWQRWSASTPVSVTGMAAGQAGEIRYVANAGSSTITLTNQDAASTAANRWLTTTGADLALAANRMALAIYDATTAAWRATLLP